MSSLSTHVLDTAQGRPAANVTVRLCTADGQELMSGMTNADGRCLAFPALETGRYRLEFAVAAYYRDAGFTLPEPPFLDVIAVDFGIAGDGHYHVPLLVSPYGYSTYRGS